MEVTEKRQNTDQCQASSSVSSDVHGVLCPPCVEEDLDMATSAGGCPHGKLSSVSQEEISITEFEPVYSHGINSKTDKTNVKISNMLLLLPDKLLCVDWGNNSLKVVDTKQKCISSEIQLESEPWDITFISDNQVAVTLPYTKKIIFLSIRDNNLASEKEVVVDGECRGITCHKDTLVVSFVKPSKLQTLTLNGEVIRTLSAENLGWCSCLVVSNCGNYFFSSDFCKDRVEKFSFDGTLSATYQNTDLKGPRSISVCKDGSVLVCSRGNDELHLMSQYCRKIKKIPIAKDRLNDLQSVCYCETSATMYLSNYFGETVLVYKQA